MPEDTENNSDTFKKKKIPLLSSRDCVTDPVNILHTYRAASSVLGTWNSTEKRVPLGPHDTFSRGKHRAQKFISDDDP